VESLAAIAGGGDGATVFLWQPHPKMVAVSNSNRVEPSPFFKANVQLPEFAAGGPPENISLHLEFMINLNHATKSKNCRLPNRVVLNLKNRKAGLE
jgi:hypothetical protein